MIALDAPVFAPDIALEEVAKRSVDWWLTSEDFYRNLMRVKGTGHLDLPITIQKHLIAC